MQFFLGCSSQLPGSVEKVADSKLLLKEKIPEVAALIPVPSDQKSAWLLPENLVSEGSDVFSRVVTGKGLLAPQALELATGAAARTEYFIYLDGSEDEFSYRFQFLSTQGTGRLGITALSQDGRPLATVGYVFTGSMPLRQERSFWFDRRLPNNYQGGWEQAKIRASELVAAQIANFAPESVARYRVGIEAGQGQHVLITELKSASVPTGGVKSVWRPVPAKIAKGEILSLAADITNESGATMEDIQVRLMEPYGYGIVALGETEQKIARLASGETVTLHWQVKAQRASAVNLGQAWVVRLSINQAISSSVARLEVNDPAPGKIFYVMTEDLEPMDAAGYPTAWGNQNGWLDAEEFKVQLIDKAEAINRIADKHGARWTHYLAMPVMDAGEWAASLSSEKKWRTVLDQVRESVRSESKKGHEYALHLHSDYDPAVPGNVLSYNPAVDGFWGNHLRHGWAHSFPEEGSIHQRGTRTGVLFHHLRELTKLTESFPTGEVLTSRTGSFDFGNGPESEAMSIRAYKKTGLWGNSDADGNAGGITSGEFRKAVYATPLDDINAPATDLHKLGIVEFRPTPRQLIMYDVDSAAVMNEKARQGMAAFLDSGKVRSGVQAIVGFTHAMFIMSPQGWKSTVGGHFQALDDHLGFLKREYVQKGLLFFGTATDLVREYIDYYWPDPVVLCGPLLRETSRGKEFSLDFLGRDIPVDEKHQHNMELKIPLRYWDSGLWATLLKNDQLVTEQLLSPNHHELRFIWNNRQDSYLLTIGQRIAKVLTVPGTVPGRNLFETRPAPGTGPPPLPGQPDKLLKGLERTRV